MRYQKLGHTGLFVSELCLGTMTFGGEGACGGKWGSCARRRQSSWWATRWMRALTSSTPLMSIQKDARKRLPARR